MTKLNSFLAMLVNGDLFCHLLFYITMNQAQSAHYIGLNLGPNCYKGYKLRTLAGKDFNEFYFRILVLDKGQVKEFDSPDVLLNDKKSIFYGMAKDAGLV